MSHSEYGSIKFFVICELWFKKVATQSNKFYGVLTRKPKNFVIENLFVPTLVR